MVLISYILQQLTNTLKHNAIQKKKKNILESIMHRLQNNRLGITINILKQAHLILTNLLS